MHLYFLHLNQALFWQIKLATDSDIPSSSGSSYPGGQRHEIFHENPGT